MEADASAAAPGTAGSPAGPGNSYLREVGASSHVQAVRGSTRQHVCEAAQIYQINVQYSVDIRFNPSTNTFT